MYDIHKLSSPYYRNVRNKEVKFQFALLGRDFTSVVWSVLMKVHIDRGFFGGGKYETVNVTYIISFIDSFLSWSFVGSNFPVPTSVAS